MGLLKEDESIRFRRFVPIIDSQVDKMLIYPPGSDESFCSIYYDPQSFLNKITSEVAESLYYSVYSHLDDGEKTWAEIYNLIVDYVEKEHKAKIYDHWYKECHTSL